MIVSQCRAEDTGDVWDALIVSLPVQTVAEEAARPEVQPEVRTSLR
jgi:hypothetical protein